METLTTHNKLTKSKGKMVKPILKKLHSEKNSLDLDRPWEEQQGPGLGVFGSGYDGGSSGRSARDVNFNFPKTSPIPIPIKQRLQHVRTPSGTSHTSVTTTGSAGGRSSGFVHPFQLTPRTQTPPLTFGNSVTSLENANTATTTTSGARDYSPTITENDDDDEEEEDSGPSCTLPAQAQQPTRTASNSQPCSRHPSLVSQRAASLSDVSGVPPLRVKTKRTASNGHARRSFGGNTTLVPSVSQSDLHLNSSSTFDSATTPTGPAAPASFVSSGSVNTAGTSSISTPLSPLRTSFEGVAFPRLRSRSELYTGDRSEQIREARRKFEERERVKAEKHDREMLRKRERRDHKEAKEIEKQGIRKSSGSFEKGRSSLSHRTSPTFGGSMSGPERAPKHGRRSAEVAEKPVAFKSSNYDNMAGGMTPSFEPTVDDVAFRSAARRNHSAKRKTQGYWNEFILWLRTRLFRLGRK